MNRRRMFAGFFLLGVYTGVLLWLLFWRERTTEGIPYLHRLPMHLNLSPLRTIRLYLRLLRSSQPHLVRIALVNLAGNIVMFLPLGFLPPLLFSGLRRWYRMLPAAAGIIAAAELLQMLLLVGTCDVDDLILNLLGTAAGYGLFALTKSRRQKNGQLTFKRKTVRFFAVCFSVIFPRRQGMPHPGSPGPGPAPAGCPPCPRR